MHFPLTQMHLRSPGCEVQPASLLYVEHAGTLLDPPEETLRVASARWERRVKGKSIAVPRVVVGHSQVGAAAAHGGCSSFKQQCFYFTNL